MSWFARPAWTRRLSGHPIVPLLVMVVIMEGARENYPFSPYPMYSRPSPRPLPFQYLADANGQPLPVVWHTGVTPSRLGKKFGYHKKQLHRHELKEARAEKRQPRGENEFKPEAGREVLRFLRQQSLLRNPDRHLSEDVQLMETKLSFAGNRFEEKTEAVGRLRD